MPEAAWRAVIEDGDARKLPVAVHIYYLADAKATLLAGADLIAHSVRDVPVDDQFINALEVPRRVLLADPDARDLDLHLRFDAAVGRRSVLPEGRREGRARAAEGSEAAGADPQQPGWKSGQQYKASLEVAKKNLKTLVDRGVRIAMGTDTGPPARFQGFFEHLELEMMVEAGMTPMQVIVSATGDAARCHGRAGQIGTLAAGAAADLLILNANPLENIRNMRSIDAVWINGKKAY